MRERVIAVTTIDNPFDPIDDFDNWYKYDVQKNYNSCSYLARLSNTSDNITEAEYDAEVEDAIDSMVRWNPLLYKKIVREKETSDTSN